jgi:hypothetical protein
MMMSRGPGKWQRAILAALEDGDYGRTAILDVVWNATGELRRTDLVAARRALRRLAETGQCRAIYLWDYPLDKDGNWLKGYPRRVSLVATRLDDETPTIMGKVMPDWIAGAEDVPARRAAFLAGLANGESNMKDYALAGGTFAGLSVEQLFSAENLEALIALDG